ncbi:dnaA protein helix-turn-helix [Gemmobacter megaterium]|uniref:DnaA protein helix-turn-helix n=1 Tax=Gemmobacter megaterium TaxID=1086013 RepID=A0A1N7QIP1_9RHOB|nr:helix-turn-helix domain-containing protein [Gemmobacter megaterium]GGE26740.1 hypothetical protein GCM10011345_35920 [Gemmobacter megaterium]SIT22656.1 dnaA protein helix-turn-helix [Gemmobacter megaterium]
MEGDQAFRVRHAMLASLDGLEQAVHSIGAAVAAEFGDDAVARVRAIEADAQMLRRVLLPESMLDEVIEVVARTNGLPVAAIRGAGRSKPVVAARWAVMAIARKRGMSAPEIARALRCDQSSVTHGLRRVAAKLEAAG